MKAEDISEFMSGPADAFAKSDFLNSLKERAKLSEREIARVAGASKSQIHRLLSLRDVPAVIREAVQKFEIDLYVCYRWLEAEGNGRSLMQEKIESGEVRTHDQATRFLRSLGRDVRTRKRLTQTDKDERLLERLERQAHRIRIKIEEAKGAP